MAELLTLAPPETEAPAAEWPRVLRWTRQQYHRLGEQGHFEGRRVELIEGHIVEMSPMNQPHWTAAALMAQVLRAKLPSGYFVLEGYPFAPLDDSEPEPDVAVFSGSVRDYEAALPSNAVLVVEISDTTLAFDRGAKLRLYAAAGVGEYWILNLKQRQLEIFRDPISESHLYSHQSIVAELEIARPLFAPHLEVKVEEVLPSKR